MQPSGRVPQYFGWRVAGAAHVCLMLGFGLYACTFSVFVKPLASEFHWTRGTIATGFALSALAVAIVSPLAGGWVDRGGPRAPLILSVSVFGVAFLCFSRLSSHLWHFYLLCLVLGSVGNIVQMGYTQALSSWFEARRGFALGVMLSGEGVGLIIFPPLTQLLVNSIGWRIAYSAMGAAVLLLSLPLTLLFARAKETPHDKSVSAAHANKSLVRNLQTAAFWIILAVLFLGSLSVNGAMTQQIPMLTDRGLAGSVAAISVSVLGLCSLTGRLLTGWLLDRCNGPAIACLLLCAAGIGIALLASAGTFMSACVAAALLGFGAGGTSSVTPYLLTRYFGTQGFSTLYGFTWTVYAIAGGAGPMLLGYVYDSTHSYVTVLMVLAGATAVGACLALLLPATRPLNNDRSALDIREAVPMD